jgi:uncharacterized membrane protein
VPSGPLRSRELTPWLLGGVAAAALLAVATLRWATFHSAAYDLAFFDQVVWNASAGHGLRSSFVDYGFLGQHFEPALLLLVPLYRLHPSPLWLFGAQSLALGLAVVPLWALAREWLTTRRAALVAVLAYLLQVGLARAAGFDFHTEALAVPFVFLALLGAARGSTPLLLLAGAVPLLCKEDGALVTIGVGVLALAVHRRRAGLVLAGGGLAAGALVTLVLMPRLRGGAAGDLIDRYRYLGATPGAVVAHVVTSPQSWLGHLLSAPAGPALLLALAGAGLLPLLRPAALAACLPPLLLALLSADPFQSGLRLHYGLPAVPLLIAAALAGWRSPIGRRLGAAAPVLLLGGAATTWALAAPLPWGPGPDRLDLGGLGRAAAATAALERIPSGAPVAASGSLLTHLAERPVVFELPSGVGVAWVAVDQGAPATAQSHAAGYDAAVASLAGRGYHRVAGGGAVAVWHLGD